MLKNFFIRKLFKSKFSYNVLTLITGTTLAQAIPIIISPILTRLYTPEDFGVLGLFLALTSIFGSIANAKYELAILKPIHDRDAINIGALAVGIAFLFSFFLFLVVIIFNYEIKLLLNNSQIGFWLYFVPIIVFVMGIFNVLNYLNTRKKLYKDIAVSKVLKSSSMVLVNLSFGLIKSGATGLILGQIFSTFVSNFNLFKKVKKNYNFKNIKKSKIKKLAIKYNKFPKYSLLSATVNKSSDHVITFLISSLYGLKTLGFYFLPYRVLGIPSSFISNSIGQVFFQEATLEKIKTGNTKKIFNKTLKNLFVISFIIFFPLYLFIEDIFIFVFGENWTVAGKYAKILLPLFFIKFIVSPLTVMNIIFNKNEVGMYWQIILIFLHVILITFVQIYDLSIEFYFQIMVKVIGIHYLIILIIISRYNKKKDA